MPKRFFTTKRIAAGLLIALMPAFPLVAADEAPRGSYLAMDYGPVLAETISAPWPEENLTLKGLSVRLDHDAAMVFDTDLMRWSASTIGGWIDLSKTSLMTYKGSRPAGVEGEIVTATAPEPGWAFRGSFADPRPETGGNLPREWTLWHGFFRFGDRVVLSYRIGETEILESPATVEVSGRTLFVRSLETSGSKEWLHHYLAELPDGATAELAGNNLRIRDGDEVLVFRVESAVEGLQLQQRGNRVELTIPAHEQPLQLSLLTWREAAGSQPVSENALRRALRGIALDFAKVQEGGPSRWEESVKAEFITSEDDAAYVVETIEMPFENPWGSWFRPSAFGFFPDGDRAAVATWSGDIWVVSGLQSGNGEVTWDRFASGLFYPMGIVVLDETIHVTERSQLTRLHDLNGDGEADFYESVNNAGLLYPMAHSLCLEVDSEGNFYFFKNGNRVPSGIPEHGALIRVSADGREREVFATGIRGANGLGIDTNDRIFSADQQGNWVPTARVDWLREGGFYGFRQHNPDDRPEGDYDLPVVWIPHRIDNSSGELSYIHDERWGPMAGNWVVTSYGQSALLALYVEEKGDLLQGGVATFPLEFSSGIMRSEMNPADGQLYVMGMRGWQTTGIADGSFDRVRYTGLPNRMPVGIGVEPGTVRIDFSEKLDPESLDVANFEVERWQYAYTSAYGSPEMSIENPGERGRDPVAVSGVRLSEDGQSVFVDIPDLKPVQQQSIAYRVTFSDGTVVEDAVYQTIHRLSDDDEAPGVKAETAKAEAPEAEPEVVEEATAEEPAENEALAAFAPGREIFLNTCTACHQVDGQGLAPALSESEWAGGNPNALIRILLQGKIGSQGVMTPFSWLSDEDLAMLLSYIRVRWHEEEPITAAEVQTVREATAGRTDLWTAEELSEF